MAAKWTYIDPHERIAQLQAENERLREELLDARCGEMRANDAYIALREIFKLKDKVC